MTTPSLPPFVVSRQLGSQPSFEKRARFRAFQTPPHGVQHGAAHGRTRTVKSKPVRHVQFDRFEYRFDLWSASVEKPLLKHRAQNLFAQQFMPARFSKSCRHAVPTFDVARLRLIRHTREFV